MGNDESSPELDPYAAEAVSELLGEIPSPTIPPDVGASVLAAITAESEKRASESDSNVSALRRPSRSRRLLPVAVSAAVVGLLGFLIWPFNDDRNVPDTYAASTGCTVGASDAVDMSPVLHASGTAYTNVSLQSQAESMAMQPAVLCDRATVGDSDSPSSRTEESNSEAGWAEASPSAEADALGGSTLSLEEPEVADQMTSIPHPGQDANRQVETEQQDPLGLRGERIVRRCVVSVVEGRDVHAVDVATFAGRPAVVVVVASPREVLVLKCGTGKTRVLAQQALT